MITARTLAAQVADAQKRVQRLKRASPELFPEWHAWKRSQDDVARAKATLARAHAAWKAVGGG